eukprot:8674708-Pyramimonas_sp.AAC.1
MELGSLFTDLKKTYECVSHPSLGSEAASVKFKLKVVRAACALCSGPRAITFQNCCSGVFVVPDGA